MEIVETEYTLNDAVLGYRVLEDGYEIYVDDNAFIVQQEPLIPYRKDTYEESAIEHIKEIAGREEEVIEQPTIQEAMKKIELLEGCIMDLAVLIDELYGGDGNEE